MFRSTQGHPQVNTEHTRNNKVSTQWDAISFNSGYYGRKLVEHDYQVYTTSAVGPLVSVIKWNLKS
jgi:hypothetical protein